MSVHDLDLRRLYVLLGSGGHQPAASVSADETRSDRSAEVEWLEDPGPHDLEGDALVPTGFVDGIQAAPILTHRSRRPVHLVYVAAGAVSSELQPLPGAVEELFLAGSVADAAFLEGVRGDVELRAVDVSDPPGMAAAIANLVASRRSRAEHKFVRDSSRPGDCWVLDGDLVSRSDLRDQRDSVFVAVAKTFRTRWLADESLLWGLRFAQRTGVFVIDQGRVSERFSCYVQIQHAGDVSWTHGLLRLESFSADALPAAAVMCVDQRQTDASVDGRWDRHLAPVRAVEDYLRALRPPVFRS